MIVVGLIAGWLAGPIWKHKRPIGVRGDYIAAVITAVAVGMLDWYMIPAMEFSDSLRNLGVASEPFLGALLGLWIIRAAEMLLRSLVEWAAGFDTSLQGYSTIAA